MTTNPKRRYIRDEEGYRHLLVQHHGFDGYFVRWTQHCTGCTETPENTTPEERGMGCGECGFTGKRRMEWFVPLDHAAFEAWLDDEWRKSQLSEARSA